MNKTELIPFRTTPDERTRLDKMAASCGMTRSELIRHIVRTTQAELVTTSVSPAEPEKGLATVSVER